jgi:hypothetical protein
LWARVGRPDDARRHLDALESCWRAPDGTATPLLTAARAAVTALPQ